MTIISKCKCEICDNANSIFNINYTEKYKVCSSCYAGFKLYYKDNIDSNSVAGLKVISKYILSNVLEDCKPNIHRDFNYSLQSKSLGKVQLRCDVLHLDSWLFCNLNDQDTNFYFLFGYNNYKTEILKVWCIPNKDPIINSTKLKIHNNETGWSRFEEYELDSEVFNNEYWDISYASIPEFRNYIPKEVYNTNTRCLPTIQEQST